MAFADLILTDARIYTGDAHRPSATALAIAGGTIVAFDADVDAWRGDATRVRDLAGAFVMPGFIDVHNHHALAGRGDLFELSFSPGLGLDDVIERIAAYARALPDGAWVTGGSWGSGLLSDLNSSAVLARLDAASAGHPVMLTDDSHHNRWVNSAAMAFADETDETEAGVGGVVMRDPVDGALTGVLLESAGIAVAAAAERVAPLDEAAQRACSARGIEILSGFGVTAFQDAAVSLPIMRALAQLDDTDALNAWVVSSMVINDDIFGFSPVGADLMLRGEEFRREHHRPDFVKIFLDGVPPARTGAFLEPYLPDDAHGAHFCGETTIPAEELYDWLRTAAERGLSAKVHCTGDASARALLDAVERLRAEGFSGARFQLAHGQFLADDDLPRLASLDVSADISPFLWFPGVIPDAIATALPADRASRMQPNRSLLDLGANIAGGSDWPVSESPNPWEGIQGLVTRADPLGRAPGTLWPEQAITLPEAIAVFTRNAAEAMGLDDVTGSLEIGKSADLIVLDRDPFEIPVDTLIETRVRETWFAGRLVHADQSTAAETALTREMQ
ncbi:MAG: amidohydrolase [Microbacterium sp.]